jgi:hypothetical protein
MILPGPKYVMISKQSLSFAVVQMKMHFGFWVLFKKQGAGSRGLLAQGTEQRNPKPAPMNDER